MASVTAMVPAGAQVFTPTEQNNSSEKIFSFLHPYEIEKVREASKLFYLSANKSAYLRGRVGSMCSSREGLVQTHLASVPFYLYQDSVTPGVVRVLSCRTLAILAERLKGEGNERTDEIAKQLGVCFRSISRWYEKYSSIHPTVVIKMNPPRELSNFYMNTWKITDRPEQCRSLGNGFHDTRRLTSAEKVEALYRFLENKSLALRDR